MNRRIYKSAHGQKKIYEGEHRFEHWYRDNQVYFITARCRDKYPAFADERATQVFWDRFFHYTQEAQFIPWVVSLMRTHYHVLGYCTHGPFSTVRAAIPGSPDDFAGVFDCFPGRPAKT